MEFKNVYIKWLESLNTSIQSRSLKKQWDNECKQGQCLIQEIHAVEKSKNTESAVDSVRSKFNTSVEDIKKIELNLDDESMENFQDRNILVANTNIFVDQLLIEKNQIQQKIQANINSMEVLQLPYVNQFAYAKLTNSELKNLKKYIKELKQLKRKLKNTTSAIFNHLENINNQVTANKSLLPVKAIEESSTLKLLKEELETLRKESTPLYKEDTQSCYSDQSFSQEIISDKTSNKRILQIVLTERNGSYESKLHKDLKSQKQYNIESGFDQDQIAISVEDLLDKGAFDERLAEKLNWAIQADTFIIQTNDDSIPIDKEAAHDLKNVVEVLVRHGLENPDYQKKGTLNFESCYTGLWSLQRASETLIKNKVGGLHLEGTNHKVLINGKYISKVKYLPFGKKALPSGKVGEALVSFGNGRYERARAKDFKGNYKYLNTIYVPPSTNSQKHTDFSSSRSKSTKIVRKKRDANSQKNQVKVRSKSMRL